MQVPLEISYHNIEGSQWIDEYIAERAEHLNSVCPGIISCRVVVERAQHQHNTGNPFRVRVEVKMPPQIDLIGDKEEVVENPQTQLRGIIRHAFDAVEKQAKKQKQMLRGQVKQHNSPETLSEPRPLAPPVGFVVKIFREEGYGFIKVPADSEEYYFHRNAVLHDDFERIENGVQVRFEPSMGDDGPQASTVQLIDKPGKRAGGSGHETAQPPSGWA